jgi:hypothetical protein
LPVYDLSAAAHATDFDAKQLDNLLSRNEMPGLEKKKRGVARRLTPDVVVAIRLAKELSDALNVSPGSVLGIASRIEREGSGEVSLGSGVTLRIDLNEIRATTLARLDTAVEVVGRRRRGRPPKRGASPEESSA